MTSLDRISLPMLGRTDNNLWIATDGAPGAIGLSDGLFKVPLRSETPPAGAWRGPRPAVVQVWRA